jgi:aminoglycoside phosphotransferase (APT) family kinase protein
MIKQIRSLLFANWDEYFPGISRPEKLSFLLKSGHNKVSLLVFKDGESVPVCLVKRARSGAASRIKEEYDILKFLVSFPDIGNDVPRPFFFGMISGEYVMIETILKGCLMFNLVRKKGCIFWFRKFKENTQKTASWLAKFHRIVRSDFEVLTSEKIMEKLPKIKKLENQKGCFKEIRRLMKEADGLKLPLVVQHQDINPGNILVGKKGISVFDWEYAKRKGLPLFDLLYFIFNHWYIAVRARKFRHIISTEARKEYLKELFLNEGGISKFVYRVIDFYCREVGIAPPVAYLLFLKFCEEEYMFPEILEEILKKRILYL